MVPPVQSFIAMALAGMTCIASASGTSTLTSTAPSPIATPSGIEVDIIFPVQNATYNDTESLPIVFALQNLTAASAYGPFMFSWGIVPYYGGSNVYNLPNDANTNAYWETRFTTANNTIHPYILVNQTDVQEWSWRPVEPGQLYGFALQWAIQWETCYYQPVNGTMIFNAMIGSPEPDLGSLVGKCPQLGGSFQISNSSCPAVVNSSAVGNPCAVDLNETTVASISSSVQSLITASASASASATATDSATATSTSSLATHNGAFACNVPSPYVFIVTALSALQMMISL